jgi:DNA-binding NarL/FixJ family response regulator
MKRTLSPRETDVCKAIVAGRQNKEIARDHGLSVGTIKTHIDNMLRKTGVRNRVELAVWAVRNGILH